MTQAQQALYKQYLSELRIPNMSARDKLAGFRRWLEDRGLSKSALVDERI